MIRYYVARAFNWLPRALRSIAYGFGLALASERGAFALTNLTFPALEGPMLPVTRKQLADQTAAVNTDMGVVGLKWIRVRILIKSGMANTNTVLFAVRVGTGSGVTNPELVATSATYTFVTNDTNICIVDLLGFSQNGFQSFKVTPTNGGGAASYDILADAA